MMHYPCLASNFGAPEKVLKFLNFLTLEGGWRWGAYGKVSHKLGFLCWVQFTKHVTRNLAISSYEAKISPILSISLPELN